jgi:hypothetical protein
MKPRVGQDTINGEETNYNKIWWSLDEMAHIQENTNCQNSLGKK